MAKENHISFEDWVEWMFDRQDQHWVWQEHLDRTPWIDNRRLLAEHVIQLHNNPVPALKRFSNGQIGAGLWNLYSSSTEYGMYGARNVPVELHHQLIRSLIPLQRQLLPKRVPLDQDDGNDLIAGALYMFWDMAPIWPFKPTDADKVELEVCLEEMRQTLMIPHPAAHKHALHGLGHFQLQAPERTTPIIDEWLKSNPHITPSIREYALRARVGAVA